MAETEVQQSNSRRIAKNALMLYIRMFLSMIVGLYTSRVVLNTLGVEDYGIYGVVGGVVSMMGFLNASMSGATSRFITFELGKGNTQRLKDTFSSAMIVHIGIAVVVFIVAETIGLWFLNNKLVIPENRMYAAHWVYQLSIFSAMLGITQVPYNASIIAHERMGIYAYIEILNVSLKLLIVYLLLIGNFDKLILYAILTLAVSVIVMMTYRIYCIKNFSECHFHWIWDKKILKPLLSFSGWDLYGNLSLTARQQGSAFLINIFFGVLLNTANSIAQMITGVINGLAANITIAYQPQITKAYANQDYKKQQDLMCNCAKYSILIIGATIIPLLINMPFYIRLWLKQVPLYSDVFCKIGLLGIIIGFIGNIINIGIHATGNIKRLSFISGTIYLLNIPLLYLLYKCINMPEYAYYLHLFLIACIVLTNSVILKKQIPQISLIKYYYEICKVIIVLTLVFSCCYILYKNLSYNNILVNIYIILCDIVLSIPLSYWILLGVTERSKIKIMICQKFHKSQL